MSGIASLPLAGLQGFNSPHYLINANYIEVNNND